MIKNGYIIEGNDLQHRKIAEQVLNRKLNEKEVIHHIDHNPLNNSPDNFMLFETQKLHKSFENKELQFGKTRYILEEIERRKITNIAKSLDHDNK
jgi:hypothetical protein